MPLRDDKGRFCGTLTRKEVDGKWDRNFFVLDEDKNLLRYFSLMNSQGEVLDWDDYEGEINIRFITKIEDKTKSEGYIEIQTCDKKFYVRADTEQGSEDWVRTLRKAAVNPSKRQEVPQEKVKSSSDVSSENSKHNGGNTKPESISYQTKIIGGVVVRTPVRKTSDNTSDGGPSFSGDLRVRTGSGGPTSTIKIIKEGYLIKKGALVKNWKKRYFKLDLSKLAYYEKELDRDALRVIPTCDINDVRESSGVDSGREHIFEVITTGRIFLIQAQTADEMNSWIDAIAETSVNRGRPRSASGPSEAFTPHLKQAYENYAETTRL